MRHWLAVAFLAGAVTVAQAAEGGTAAALPSRQPASPVQVPADTFPHARHARFNCLTCHLSASQSMLAFKRPEGCQRCHHRDPARLECSTCHRPDSVPATMERHLSISAAGRPPQDRVVTFPHRRHARLGCTTCHGEPGSLLPVDSAATCQGCHAQHHEAGRDCATCHTNPSLLKIHGPPARVHVACDACHATANIAALTPTRSFCLVCHRAQVDHQVGRECTTCHFQATPEQYRARLLRQGKAG